MTTDRLSDDAASELVALAGSARDTIAKLRQRIAELEGGAEPRAADRNISLHFYTTGLLAGYGGGLRLTVLKGTDAQTIGRAVLDAIALASPKPGGPQS